MKLTAEQQRAVTREGQDVCVVAGPGSGKTTVLIERFVWLVEQRGIDPARILAITFTEKAATEIRERLVRAVAPGDRERMERATVSTIHGLCAKLLREHSVAAGLAPDFTILDETWASQMERESADLALDRLFREDIGAMRRLLEALDTGTQEDGRRPDLAAALISVYEALRSEGARLGEPNPMPPSRVSERTRNLLLRVLREPVTGLTAAQQTAHQHFREAARRLADCIGEPVTGKHFSALEAMKEVKRGKLKANSSARLAMETLAEELLPALAAEWAGAFHADLHRLLAASIREIDLVFRARKRERAALDFSDLEEQTIELLQRDSQVREHVRGGFEEILMDELQDTNRLQWRLVDSLRRPSRFFAVGDINQSIYGFRHADPGVFEEYRQRLRAAGGTIDDLRDNHRSRAAVLDAVSRMTRGLPGIEDRPLVPARPYLEKSGPSVEILIATPPEDGESGRRVEATQVAARIREIAGGLLVEREGRMQPARFRDIGVLVRTFRVLDALEPALREFGIPYTVAGGRTFFEEREVLDLLHLLRVIANPPDSLALAGVLRSPLVGLNDEQILDDYRPAWFLRQLAAAREIAGYVAADELLSRFLDASGYTAGLGDAARANVEKLLVLLRRRHRARPQTLEALIDDLDSLRSAESEATAPPPEAGDVVRVMTIHAAKGLEFPVVFLPGLDRGPDRRKPLITFSSEHGLGAAWRNPAGGKPISDPARVAWTGAANQREAAEEDRLLYVALTRAREHLLLSFAEPKRPQSRWLEIAQKLTREPNGLRVARFDYGAAPVDRSSEDAAGAGDRVIGPPGGIDQRDGEASATSIALFHQCPRKYYLSRYLGVAGLPREPESRERLPSSDLGIQVHAILAGDPPENPAPEALELCRRFEASPLAERVARAVKVEREWDFLFPAGDLLVRGQADLWFEEGGEHVLVDYKTDRDENGAGQYRLQMQIYALGMGLPVDRAILFFLRSGRALEVPLDADPMPEVREFQAAQASGQFPVRTGRHCRRCVYLGRECPADATFQVSDR